MANEYSADVPKGFNVPKQVRLDSITGIQNEDALKDLGTGNNLAFKYYDSIKIHCKDEKTEYIWREVVGLETGLLDTAFTYPTYPPVDGVDYSGKTYNFFLIPNPNIEPPDGSETKLIEGINVTITGTGTILDPYEISSTLETSETYIEEGDNVIITGTGIISDPYIINTDLTDLGIVKTIDDEIIAPGQTLSIINDEVTGKVLATREYVESVIPLTPDGSETKLQEGANITITGIGTTLDPYIINSISEDSVIYINEGDGIDITGDGSISTPYIISSAIIQPDTKTEYNDSLTDGDFLFVGDVTQYTDELARDAVGQILTDTDTIEFEYNDSLNTISAEIKTNSIDATHLTNTINNSEFINDSNYATILSPIFTGTPAGPTAAPGTNTTQLATTAFVQNIVSSGTYTPTLTNTTNITSSVLNAAYYTKIDDIVTVTLAVVLTLTATLTDTVLTFSLPISGANVVNGIGQSNVTSGGGGLNAYGIVDITNSTTAQLRMSSTVVMGTGPGIAAITFTYSL
jgi:hypothetical protein